MEFVSYIETRKGKKLLKVFKSKRAVDMFLKKNTDKILSKSGIEKVGSMSKREWDSKEAKYAVKEASMDWEKNFKWANDKELKVISKFIFMNPKGIDGVIKMSKHKPSDFKKTIQKAAKAGLYKESVNEVSEKDRKKIDFLRKTAPGYIGPKFAKKASDEDILAMADLKDQKARIYNRYVKVVDDAIAKLQKKYRIKESVNESASKEIIALRKKAKSEKAFYDVLDKVEKKYGKRSFEGWLDKSLRDLRINPKKYRTSAEKQEALYQAKL